MFASRNTVLRSGRMSKTAFASFTTGLVNIPSAVVIAMARAIYSMEKADWAPMSAPSATCTTKTGFVFQEEEVSLMMMAAVASRTVFREFRIDVTLQYSLLEPSV